MIQPLGGTQFLVLPRNLAKGYFPTSTLISNWILNRSDLDTYYMSGKVTANGADYTSSSNVVWVKLGEHEKITKIEAKQ